MKYAIISIAYNRISGLQRLLKSLEKADYLGDSVDLVISIDNSGDDSVLNFANKYVWKFGNKIVRTFPERQGLRKHILSCGDYLESYDAVAVFEDDIVAAEGFYSFMKSAVSFYVNDDKIAGISLYSPKWNAGVQLPFEPSPSTYDVYFLQLAQSWGQIWMKKQWQDFISWYSDNSETVFPREVPEYIAKWRETSWLKYHIRYCIEKDKYFVIPYVALATCYAEAGEHYDADTNLNQVPVLYGVKKTYMLPNINDRMSVKYDAFYERSDVTGNSDICFDLYGAKSYYQNKNQVISCKTLPYKVLGSYACALRPQEMNYINRVEGKAFFVYDLTSPTNKINKYNNEIDLTRYYFRLYNNGKTIANYVVAWFKQKIKKKIL